MLGGNWVRNYDWNSGAFIGNLVTATGKILMGAAPGTTAAINVDAASYSQYAFRAVNATTDFRISNSAGGVTIGAYSSHDLSFIAEAETKWIMGGASGVSSWKSNQVTAQIIGGATNGLAIRNSGNTRDNFLVNDLGTIMQLNDGTNVLSFYSNNAGDGEWTGVSSAIRQTTGSKDLWLVTGGAAGNKVGAVYYNGTTYYSAWEVARTASGFGTLLLMKSGGGVNIGSAATQTDTGLYIASTALTSVSQYGLYSVPTINSAGTTGGYAGAFKVNTAASAFTLATGIGVFVNTPTVGATSAITNQYGVRVNNQGAAGITNAFGVYIEAISGAATTNIGLYNAGTTVLANGAQITTGCLSIGATPATGTHVAINIQTRALSGAATQYGLAMFSSTTFGADATTGYGLYVAPTTVAAAFTLTNLYGLYVVNTTKGAGSTITNQYGLYIETPTQGGTLNYIIYSPNFYVAASGAITSASSILAGSAALLYWASRSLMSSPADGNILFSNNAATDFARLQFGGTTSSFPSLKRNGSAINFRVADDSADSSISCAAVDASNYILSSASTGGIGYKTGAGGTIVQATSKVTAFTLSKVCGTIQFAADALGADTTTAGAVWTNTAIAATDVIVWHHVSGGTIGAYQFGFACGAGTCTVKIRNMTPGSLSEAPVIAFSVIKAVTS